ncbi:MAG: hypothetical protein LBH59_10045 [Planctomycetaceae bacterium]|nr:hypothetical protein [Planctomycetaceae bacterium]
MNNFIPKPVWAVGFALEQTLRDATLAVFSFLILKRLQHIKDNLTVRSTTRQLKLTQACSPKKIQA